ncbi:MAG: beta-lactamase/transpeptidase-like protein [Linnemannia gamsii]|nr:MAG: beta-lactamase/transpeptidase-like protein [Linnemannia gamsii]
MSLAVMHRGEIIFADGFGQRNDTEPFTAETLMPIASMTKAFTSAAIGELVAEGKMDWDTTPINKYLPEFAVKDPLLTSQLTLVDLLSHRTGMPDIDIAWFKNNTPRRELIKTLRHLDHDRIPQKLGPYWKYSNTMYTIAGEAAANVAGTSWEQLVRDKILTPLGLKNTGFAPSGMMKHGDGSGGHNYAMPYDAESLKDAQAGRFEKGYLEDILKVDAPAGDMFSNVLDLVKWGRVVLKSGELDGKQVLNNSSMKEVVTPHTIMKGKMGRGKDFALCANYGLAWELDSYKGNNFYFHTGSLYGFRGSLALYPDEDIVIAFLTNTHKSALRTYIPFYIVDQLLHLPKSSEDWLSTVTIRETQVEYDTFENLRKGATLPARIEGTTLSHAGDLEQYTGKYSDPIMGTILIYFDNKNENNKDKGSLLMRYIDYLSKMSHYHYDTFRFALKDFAFEMAALATFTTAPDGRITGLDIYVADDTIHFKREKDVDATKPTVDAKKD